MPSQGFVPVYKTGGGFVVAPDGTIVAPINSKYLVEYDTAAQAAALIGGTVVIQAMEFFATSQPIYLIQVPGAPNALNAGLVADLFARYGTQPSSPAWTVIHNDLGYVAAPVPAAAPAPAKPVAVPPTATVPPVSPRVVPLPAPKPKTEIVVSKIAPAGGGGGAVGGGSLGSIFGPVGAVIGAIVGFLAGLFGGGVSKEIKRALEGLRDGINKTADTLLRFTWKGMFSFGWLLRAFQNLWVRILHPLLDHIERIANRLGRLIDKVLKPYLDLLIKIRKAILDIYERFFRPIILTIETLRRALAILRLAHIHIADKLDAELAKLEGKIAAPILKLLQQTNELAGWMRVLLNVRLLLQQPLLVNSLDAFKQIWAKMFWNAHSQPLTAAERTRLQSTSIALSPRQATDNALLAVRLGAGPYAVSTRLAVDQVLSQVRR